MHKICSKCGENKPINEFYYKKDKGSYHNQCKACMREKANQRWHQSKYGVPCQTSNVAVTEKELKKVIVLDGLDFGFTEVELEAVANMWYDGKGINEIMHHLRPPSLDLKENEEDKKAEIILAIVHLCLEGRIDHRQEGGMFL